MSDPITKNRYQGVDWKQDLRLSRAELVEHLGYDGSVLVAAERFAMRAALAFRKLLVHQVLSNEARDARWPARRFACNKPPDPRMWFDGTVDLVNHHHFVRHYDLDRPTDDEMTLKELSDRLLHSLVFVVWPRPEDRVHEDMRFFFNSDRKQSAVWEMTLGEFIDIVEEVVRDDVAWVNHSKYKKDPDRQEQHNSAWVARKRARRFSR